MFQRAHSYEEVRKIVEEIPEGPKRNDILAFQIHRNYYLGNLFTSYHQPPPGKDKQLEQGSTS